MFSLDEERRRRRHCRRTFVIIMDVQKGKRRLHAVYTGGTKPHQGRPCDSKT